jgi:hypothetical protein
VRTVFELCRVDEFLKLAISNVIPRYGFFLGAVICKSLERICSTVLLTEKDRYAEYVGRAGAPRSITVSTISIPGSLVDAGPAKLAGLVELMPLVPDAAFGVQASGENSETRENSRESKQRKNQDKSGNQDLCRQDRGNTEDDTVGQTPSMLGMTGGHSSRETYCTAQLAGWELIVLCTGRWQRCIKG